MKIKNDISKTTSDIIKTNLQIEKNVTPLRLGKVGKSIQGECKIKQGKS